MPRSWYRFVGNPDVPAQLRAMEDQSPIHSLTNSRAPLLIFQGANDPRVTKAQSDQVVRAYCSQQLPVTYLVAQNEGHSFGNEQTALGVTRAAELFLSKYLGGSAQPSASAELARAIADLTINEPCATAQKH